MPNGYRFLGCLYTECAERGRGGVLSVTVVSVCSTGISCTHAHPGEQSERERERVWSGLLTLEDT